MTDGAQNENDAMGQRRAASKMVRLLPWARFADHFGSGIHKVVVLAIARSMSANGSFELFIEARRG